MTSITRLLPRTSPLFLGPLFLLASFFLLTFKTVSPLQTLMLLGGGLAITVLGGLRSLVLVIPFTAYAFYTLLPVSLWSIGVFALTTVAYLQSALAIDEQSEEIDSKEEILKERYTLSLHEKEAANIELTNQLNKKSLELLHATEEIRSLKKLNDIAREEIKKTSNEIENFLRTIAENNKKIGDLEESQADFLSVKEALKSSNLTIREKDLEISTLKNRNQELESSIPQYEALKQTIIQEMAEHNDAIEKEKSLLESTLSRLQGDLDEIVAKQKDLINASDYQEIQSNYQQAQEKIQVLEETLSRLQGELETYTNGDIIPAPEHRRIQGMYNQLRAQFDEKNKLLAETRKELFQAQESALVLQKTLDEYSLTGQGIPELTQEISNLLRENEVLQKENERLFSVK